MIWFQYGLYSAFMGCFVYCFLGTSKDITLGPTAIMSLMTATFAESPVKNDATYAILLCLLTGCVQFLMGIFRLGMYLYKSIWVNPYIEKMIYCEVYELSWGIRLNFL